MAILMANLEFPDGAGRQPIIVANLHVYETEKKIERGEEDVCQNIHPSIDLLSFLRFTLDIQWK